MSDKTGGSAFPKQPRIIHPKVGETVMEQGGMSLRDWFAGMALQGMIASDSHVKIMNACLEVEPLSKPGAHTGTVNARIAISVYAIADALLAERAKP